VSRAPAARPSPLGWCRAARSARTRPPARGVRVCASRAHALTPFASLVLSLFFSSAFRLLLKPFIFSTPLAGVAFSHFRRCDDSPGHAVRVCASRASRPLRPFAFLFAPSHPLRPSSLRFLSCAFRLLFEAFHFPMAGAGPSDFRRTTLISDEFPGHAVRVCRSCTASHQRCVSSLPSDPLPPTLPLRPTQTVNTLLACCPLFC